MYKMGAHYDEHRYLIMVGWRVVGFFIFHAI